MPIKTRCLPVVVAAFLKDFCDSQPENKNNSNTGKKKNTKKKNQDQNTKKNQELSFGDKVTKISWVHKKVMNKPALFLAGYLRSAWVLKNSTAYY